MKKIGLIGGTSWHATIVYYRLINELVGERIGTQGNPELLIYSLNIELMRAQDKEKINAKYLEIAQTLEAAGAKALVICANTPHMVYDFVQPQVGIPILHIADAVGKEAQEKRLQTLGLLGNRPTMTGDFIPSRLATKFSIQTVIPDERYIAQNHWYVSNELTQGIFSDGAKTFFMEQMELLRQKGAEGIILGCTELPILMNETNFDLPMLATTTLHARMAADFILE